MFFNDLSLYEYHLSKPVKQILNVGWLDGGKEFTKGDSPSVFCQKLASVIIGGAGFDANFNRIRGVHPCDLCGDREVVIFSNGEEELLGMSEILIPNSEGDGYFASPSMVYHYITVHSYLPPEPFMNAVLNVDLSKEYLADDIFDALLASR
ncbi:hypothetical protein [Alcanivorax sp.]|uniref:DUF7919 family protein n=1 Tax=Alcanivorax sp. TaxID=1872427 RepID=UPI000C0CB3F7|nr:hypothetical protein [Alcanivorax sp.]PHR68538.1 MAG: hypothetical protein COA55_00540 [Alcanivorax sp.]